MTEISYILSSLITNSSQMYLFISGNYRYWIFTTN